MSDQLEDMVQRCLGNPFTAAPVSWEQALESLTSGDVASLVTARLRQGDLPGAERAWVALGHAQACQRPDSPREVLDEDCLTPRLVRRLPRNRAAYLRLVMAAGRCHRALHGFRGRSAAAQEVRRNVWAACFGESLLQALVRERLVRDHDVLIMGETGVGKEPLARAIQAGTPGPPNGEPAPSGALNAAAIPEALIESELFGHVRGAFTGAARDRVGRLRSADGGCFFLDEVGDLPRTAQVKLLRVMETDWIDPVGSDSGHQADIRYVAATHQDLGRMVEAGSFRRDLYERLAGNLILIAPLRARPEDIVDIGVGFARSYLGDDDPALPRIERWLRSPAAARYAWPGNVRELQNVLRNMMLGILPALGAGHGHAQTENGGDAQLPGRIRQRIASLREVSEWYIAEVLEQTRNNYAEAGRRLGLDRATVRRRARAAGRGLP